ncbi:sugar phosphate isomerase/epimerase family protein [Microbacterium sp. NPDC058345]|uniref:sugar phosphate isomerase/epimerase family protein n=1 Tax=Microbacterium sp. NPDC058345 TaxID=3346455 RepID=UPI00364C5336
MTIRPGLCSVTFRQLTPEQIVDLAADAGLETIEWGGDVHVPPGDAKRAAEVARLTTDAGLAVSSYGSYFRAGSDERLTPILDSAEALGADRIRVWAGSVDAADADEADWTAVIGRLTEAVAEASARGIRLSLEYHRRTLAPDPASTTRLLDAVPGLGTYWQPAVDAPDAQALREFAALTPRVDAVHVFSWWPAAERRRLHERAGLWQGLFAAASALPEPPRDALLEFVPDDEPALLAAEAATLRGWIAAAPEQNAPAR